MFTFIDSFSSVVFWISERISERSELPGFVFMTPLLLTVNHCLNADCICADLFAKWGHFVIPSWKDWAQYNSSGWVLSKWNTRHSKSHSFTVMDPPDNLSSWHYQFHLCIVANSELSTVPPSERNNRMDFRPSSGIGEQQQPSHQAHSHLLYCKSCWLQVHSPHSSSVVWGVEANLILSQAVWWSCFDKCKLFQFWLQKIQIYVSLRTHWQDWDMNHVSSSVLVLPGLNRLKCENV